MADLPDQCIACGHATDAATCPRCSTPTHIAAAEKLNSNSVRVGFLKRGKREPLVLAFQNERQSAPSSSALAIWPSGETAEISSSELNRLSLLNGITKVRSLAAALLLAAAKARTDGLLVDDRMDETILTNLLGQDVPASRRAALVLGANGAVEKIDVLPLTDDERAWLRAVVLVRLHNFTAAIDQLLSLPVDRYPAAVPLLAAIRDRTDGSHRDAADESIMARLIASGRGPVEGAAISAGLDGSSARWIDTPGFIPAGPIPIDIDTPSTTLLRFILQPHSTGASLMLPAEASLDVLDDAIDRGARFETDSPQSRVTDVQYLMARTDPSRLSDEVVSELRFDSEIVRRHLASGSTDLDASVASIQDEYLVGLIEFSRGGPALSAVAARHPELTAALDRFLADPRPETLTEDLASDESLWPRLSAALGPEATGWNPPRATNARRLLAWHLLRDGIARLFEAQWLESLESLKHTFRLSDDEALRDEALNLMACAHWQLGNDEEAKQALTSALEGNRNTSLQVNLGVVAQSLDPEAAALELARLVRESNSLELRIAAALKAVSMWLTDEVPWGTEREQGMPEPLALALRSVVVENITLDAFRQIVSLQSSFDDDWLEQASNLARSPHKGSAEARIYRARSAGPTELVEALTTELKRSGTPAWVEEERDSLVAMFVRHALAEESSGAGLFAYIAIDKGLPLKPEQRAMLIPLAVHGICDYLSEQEDGGAPNDKFTKLLADGEREARRDGSYDRFESMYTSAWARLAFAQALFARSMWVEAAGAFDRVIDQIGGIPRRRINMVPVRQVMGAIRDTAREIEKSLRPFPSYIEGDVAEFVNEMFSNAQMLARRAEEVMQ